MKHCLFRDGVCVECGRVTNKKKLTIRCGKQEPRVRQPTDCTFVVIDDGLLECTKCGERVRGSDPEKVLVRCKPVTKEDLAVMRDRLLERLKPFITRKSPHYRTLEEATAVLNVCMGCKFYAGVKCKLGICADRFFERVLLRRDSCPEKKWGPNGSNVSGSSGDVAKKEGV